MSFILYNLVPWSRFKSVFFAHHSTDTRFIPWLSLSVNCLIVSLTYLVQPTLETKPNTACANLHKLAWLFPHCQWYQCYQPVAPLYYTLLYWKSLACIVMSWAYLKYSGINVISQLPFWLSPACFRRFKMDSLINRATARMKLIERKLKNYKL